MKSFKISRGLVPVCTMALIMASACSGGGKGSGEEAFHADDDIAMVVRSLADAINVGEALDSSSYNFRGVLTDGTGRPLYTDLKGKPGEWSIVVEDSAAAVVKNIAVGDLAVRDLRNYITSSLSLDTTQVYISRDFKGREQEIYNIPGGYLLLTSTADTLPDGTIGEYLSISVRK